MSVGYIVSEFEANLLRRFVFKRALRGAHRYCRAINPRKIPFFLLGVQYSRRYEALGWREQRIYDAIHQRWMIRKERQSGDFEAARNLFRF